MLSFQPWKFWLKRTSVRLPVNARASRTAIIVASVPELVKRTDSADGIRSVTRCAHSISGSCEAP